LDLDKIIAESLAAGELQNNYRQFLNPIMSRIWNAIGLSNTFFIAAEDNYLTDQDGNTYLDLLSGLGTQILGRNNEAIKDVLKQVSESCIPSLEQLGMPILSTILAEKLVEFSDKDFQKVFFTNSGTESVEAALKLAISATGNRQFVYLNDSFHGLTLGSLGVNGGDYSRNTFIGKGQGFQVSPNDLAQIEKIIKKNHKLLAGVVLEPVMGKNGIILTREYLQLIRDLCDKYGLVLIFDEIQTGLYRCGEKFAYQLFGIKPDVIVISKALSGGVVPIGAMMYTDFIYNRAFKKTEHMDVFSGTYKENTIAMAVALTVLEQLNKQSYANSILDKEKIFRKHLNESGKLRVQGKGLLLCLYYSGSMSFLHKSIELYEKNHLMKLIMIRLIKKHRMITYTPSTKHNCIKIMPAYSITEDNIHEFCEKVNECVDFYTSQSGYEFLSELKNTYSDLKT